MTVANLSRHVGWARWTLFGLAIAAALICSVLLGYFAVAAQASGSLQEQHTR